MAFKVTTPDIAIAKAAKTILSAQSRFIKSTWAAGPVLDEFKAVYRAHPTRSRYREDLRAGGSHFAASNDPKACAWCAEGAIMKAAGDLSYDENRARRCIDAVNAFVPGRSIQSVNDKRGHKATVAALGNAIERMEKQLKDDQNSAC